MSDTEAGTEEAINLSLHDIASLATGLSQAEAHINQAVRASHRAMDGSLCQLHTELCELQQTVESLISRLQPAVLLKNKAAVDGSAGGVASDNRG